MIVGPLLEEHTDEIHAQSNGRSKDWIVKEQKCTFSTWLKKQKLSKEDSIYARMIRLLACGPSNMVPSWKAYDIKGYTFYTNAKDKTSVTYQNSGVWIEAVNANGHANSYCGHIDDVRFVLQQVHLQYA
jgi:hypothetical protein